MSIDSIARGLAAKGLTASRGYNRNSMVLMGDSRWAQFYFDNGGGQLRRSGGHFLTHALRACNQRMRVERSFALSGQRSDQYLSDTNFAQALACNSYWLSIYGVVNDISQFSNAVDYWNTYIRPRVEAWTGTGRGVILITETGANSLSGNAASMGAVHKYNRQIRDYARRNRGVILFDAAAVVMQPGSAMTLNPAYSGDGTHINLVAGGYALGAPFGQLLAQLAPPSDNLVYSAGQVFANGGVQLFDNPVMVSTASSPVGIMTGTYPTGPTGSAGPGTSSIVSSVAAGAYGNDWTLAVTAGAAGSALVNINLPANEIVGSSYFANCAMDVAAGHSNFQGVGLHLEANRAGSTSNTDDGHLSGSVGNLAAGAYSGLVLETEPLLIASGARGWFTLGLYFYFSAAGSANVTVRRLGVNLLRT